MHVQNAKEELCSFSLLNENTIMLTRYMVPSTLVSEALQNRLSLSRSYKSASDGFTSMAKKKRPVLLPLIGESIEWSNAAAPRMLWQFTELSEASRRVRTIPSFQSSRSRIRDANCPTNDLTKQELEVATELGVHKSSSILVLSAPLSDEEIPRSAKKKKVSFGWHPSSSELVDSEADFNFASQYEMLLFSQMVIMRSLTDSPSFCCRLCDGNEVFECCYDDSASNHVPGIENHLTSCAGSPNRLKHQLSKSQGNHDKKRNIGYSGLLRKRIMEHRSYYEAISSKP